MLEVVPQRPDRVFVYGSLRRGESLHGHIKKAGLRYLGRGTIRARLYDLGEYPGAVASHASTDVVQGELYLAAQPDHQLPVIDEIEEFDPNRPGRSLFLRNRATVRLRDGRRVRAWVYFLPREPAKARRLGGDYAARPRLRRSG